MKPAAPQAGSDPDVAVDDAWYTGVDHSPDPVEPIERTLRRLPVTAINRRRLAWIVGVVVTLWIVVVFARQVGDASAAAARADQIRDQNAALSQQVAALEAERAAIQKRSFVVFMARGFGLGGKLDRRFTLSPDAPPLPSNAPGSAVLQAHDPLPSESPLDAWMSLLFGPSDQNGH
jgi:hypothetical protein